MKIPSKRDGNKLHLFTHHDFMNLYKKCAAKPYSFLVIDSTLASDNSSCFKKNLLERIEKLIMTFDDKIKDENVQYNISKETAKKQHYHQVKLINMNFLQAKKYYLLIKVE